MVGNCFLPLHFLVGDGQNRGLGVLGGVVLLADDADGGEGALQTVVHGLGNRNRRMKILDWICGKTAGQASLTKRAPDIEFGPK